MDLVSIAIGAVGGAILGATVGYTWVTKELAVAKVDLANVLAKVKAVVDPAAAAVTPAAALAAAVAAVKTKVA
jgi:hypothetical protein